MRPLFVGMLAIRYIWLRLGDIVYPHYSEYMAEPPVVDNGGVFIREVIARSRKRENSPTPHPYLQKYEYVAGAGRCALFPIITLVADTDYYNDACQSVMEKLNEVG